MKKYAIKRKVSCQNIKQGKGSQKLSLTGCNFKHGSPYKFHWEGDTFEKRLKGARKLAT